MEKKQYIADDTIVNQGEGGFGQGVVVLYKRMRGSYMVIRTLMKGWIEGHGRIGH